ncbi:hypothetical protein C4D60_Mb05t15560 [Musa balbisiana]|uniref:Uncharacterized protein n=1 Tax=Musa balbisiana TaxID=52838 RepID=A0A4S8JWD3_MUSBA|nr:hypothetical protein C4D60_Mb05t15560 [Musa balbisiana]
MGDEPPARTSPSSRRAFPLWKPLLLPPLDLVDDSVVGSETGGPEGVDGGEPAGVELLAPSTVTASFIPLEQCPGVPQMKYLLPGLVRRVSPMLKVLPEAHAV